MLPSCFAADEELKDNLFMKFTRRRGHHAGSKRSAKISPVANMDLFRLNAGVKERKRVMKNKPAFAVLLWMMVFAAGGAVAQTVHKKGLIIMVEFPDRPASLAMSRVNNIINGAGYSEPNIAVSLRDYWYTQSRGKMDLTHDVVGYYLAPHPTTWYNSQPEEEVSNLIRLALDWFRNNNPGYDWNTLTASPEGRLFSIHLFSTEHLSPTIGPGVGNHVVGWVAPNGSQVEAASYESFFIPWIDGITLSTAVHEMGHGLLGLPDSYDPDGKSWGAGYYSIMGGSPQDPKVEALGGPFVASAGWADLVDIEPGKTYTLPEDGDLMARYQNPDDPLEYFIIEARKRSTPGNEAIPTERGLVIWHLDKNLFYNLYEDMTFEKHYAYSVEQADGRFDLEHLANAGDDGDMFVEGDLFMDWTLPDSKWWNGKSSGLNINSIKFLPGNQISFCNGDCGNGTLYCRAGNTVTSEYIERVQFGTMDNTTGATTYSGFLMGTEVGKGGSTPITVTVGYPQSEDRVTLWCDWNNDGFFDAREQTALSRVTQSSSFTGVVAVPENAMMENIKMRIRLYNANAKPGNNTPCGNAVQGEVEDYLLTVVGTSPAKAIAAYPTPAQRDFTLEATLGPSGWYVVNIVNALGQVVYQQGFRTEYSNYHYEKKISLEDASKGIYIINVNGPGISLREKMILY